MTCIIPPGTCIAVLAPSSAYNRKKFADGLSILRRHGFEFHVFPDTPEPHRYFAGTDDFRTQQLTEAFTNPKYGAVWAIRGGYGLTRILSQLPFDDFSPKPMIGFSDIVALQIPLAKRGFPVIHGPVIHSIPQTDDSSIEHLVALLNGNPLHPMIGETWVKGDATGRIIGGNLCILSVMCGTPWQLETDGAILVLEDIGEYVYRIDRMMQQVKSAGMFDRIAALAIGEFSDCPPPEGADFDVYDVIRDHVSSLNVPVLAKLPIGHASANRAFQWNQTAQINNGQLFLSH